MSSALAGVTVVVQLGSAWAFFQMLPDGDATDAEDARAGAWAGPLLIGFHGERAAFRRKRSLDGLEDAPSAAVTTQVARVAGGLLKPSGRGAFTVEFGCRPDGWAKGSRPCAGFVQNRRAMEFFERQTSFNAPGGGEIVLRVGDAPPFGRIEARDARPEHVAMPETLNVCGVCADCMRLKGTINGRPTTFGDAFRKPGSISTIRSPNSSDATACLRESA